MSIGPTPVQTAKNYTGAGATSGSAAFGSGVTQGNLLIARVMVGGSDASYTTPANWSLAIAENSSGNSSVPATAIFYTVVSAGMAGTTSFSFSWSVSHTWGIYIEEWHATNGWPASPLDQTQDTTFSAAQTGLDTGATSTTTQGEELWAASIAYKQGTQTLDSITAGWTLGDNSANGTANSQASFYQVVSSTGAARVQATLHTTAETSSGAIATFKDAATSRTITPVTIALQSTGTRTITPVTLALQGTGIRTITPVTMDVTLARFVPATMALSQTHTRTITPVTILLGPGQALPSPVPAQPLSVYFYRLATGNNALTVTDYTIYVTQLKWDTNIPGGFGQLTCNILVPNAALIPTELQAFSRVAVVSGMETRYLGRLEEPHLVSSSQDGDVIEVTAQGAGIELRDDPVDSNYSAKTAQNIISTELGNRTWMVMDQDTSQILPDNPAATFTVGFSGQNMEDMLNEKTFKALGQYDWAIWEHALNKDGAGFRTPQIYWTLRDTATISYTAFEDDINLVDVRPTAENSFNAVTLNYKDATSSNPASVTVQDARLGAGQTQGTAPFPWRRIRQDLTSTLLSSGQATTGANALLNLYKNGGYKLEIHLNQVRNANGQPIPLSQVRAGKNIFLPTTSTVTAFTAALPTTAAYQVNMFTIYQTSFDEDAQELTLYAQSYKDDAELITQRLSYIAQYNAADAKSQGVVQSPGVAESGNCGVSAPSGALLGDVFETGVNFKTTMTNVPTSISLTSQVSTNVNAIAAVQIKTTGFTLQLKTNAAGAAVWRGTYKTNGN